MGGSATLHNSKSNFLSGQEKNRELRIPAPSQLGGKWDYCYILAEDFEFLSKYFSFLAEHFQFPVEDFKEELYRLPRDLGFFPGLVF